MRVVGQTDRHRLVARALLVLRLFHLTKIFQTYYLPSSSVMYLLQRREYPFIFTLHSLCVVAVQGFKTSRRSVSFMYLHSLTACGGKICIQLLIFYDVIVQIGHMNISKHISVAICYGQPE